MLFIMKLFVFISVYCSSISYASEYIPFPEIEDLSTCIVNYEKKPSAFQYNDKGSLRFLCTDSGGEIKSYEIKNSNKLSDADITQLKLLHEMTKKQNFKLSYCDVDTKQKGYFHCVFHK